MRMADGDFIVQGRMIWLSLVCAPWSSQASSRSSPIAKMLNATWEMGRPAFDPSSRMGNVARSK